MRILPCDRKSINRGIYYTRIDVLLLIIYYVYIEENTRVVCYLIDQRGIVNSY